MESENFDANIISTVLVWKVSLASLSYSFPFWKNDLTLFE